MKDCITQCFQEVFPKQEISLFRSWTAPTENNTMKEEEVMQIKEFYISYVAGTDRLPQKIHDLIFNNSNIVGAGNLKIGLKQANILKDAAGFDPFYITSYFILERTKNHSCKCIIKFLYLTKSNPRQLLPIPLDVVHNDYIERMYAFVGINKGVSYLPSEELNCCFHLYCMPKQLFIVSAVKGHNLSIGRETQNIVPIKVSIQVNVT